MKEVDGITALTFWDHLDELRSCLIRMAIVTVVCGLAAFFFKEEMFRIVLAPGKGDFITYKVMETASGWFLPQGGVPEAFSVRLINTGLAEQFLIHMRTSMYAGVLCASPYILYLLFRFVSPALYEREKRYAFRMVGGGYLMFMSGVALSYLLIFPLTFRFLGTYQVSTEVENTITLQSYMDTLMMLSLMMGIVFEIPMLCWLLAQFGLVSAGFMRRYRRHAIIMILVIAAIITPTSDIFTLSLVALPMWLLYEASILIVQKTTGKALQKEHRSL